MISFTLVAIICGSYCGDNGMTTVRVDRIPTLASCQIIADYYKKQYDMPGSHQSAICIPVNEIPANVRISNEDNSITSSSSPSKLHRHRR